MQSQLTQTGLVAILRLPEGFMSEKEVRNMRDAVRKGLVHGNNKLVVDLGVADRINSMVIGALVEMYTSYTNIDGHILFANPRERAKALFSILKLDQVLEFAATVDIALARLQPRKSASA